MTRWLDRLTVLLLLVAVALLARDALTPTHLASRAPVPLLLPSDPPGSLHMPEADTRALHARAASVGEVITVEDLVRLMVALEAGAEAPPELGTVAPLTDAERAELRALLQQTVTHRDALLEAEGDLARADDDLRAASVRLAAALSPAQRRWIRTHRDQVSVADIEAAYWERAAQGLQ